MNRHGWKGTAAVLVAALLLATLPAAPARAETGDDSMGASIAIGLMVAVVAVYGLVALRSDVERYTQNDLEQTIARAAQAAEQSPVVLQALTSQAGLGAGPGAPAEVAGAGIGLRVEF